MRQNMRNKTWIELSASALLHNVKEARLFLDFRVQLLAVVKANAYGHGLVEIARVLEEHDAADWYGVDSVDEGIALRGLGVTRRILVLGYTPLEALADAVENNLDLTVYTHETIRALAALERPARLHVKVETGTYRQGVHPEQLKDFVREILLHQQLTIVGISTHLATLEDDDGDFAQEQYARFSNALRELASIGIVPEVRHVVPSAGIFAMPQAYGTMVRFGISMYGYGSQGALRPVLTWKTIVAQIKSVPRGVGVGYGLTERVERDTILAVLPVGYADGFDRRLSSQGVVLIRGTRCKVLGRVCMNMSMVDVTDVHDVSVEDEVVIIGMQGDERITADDIALQLSTISYEVLARLNPLLPKVVV